MQAMQLEDDHDDHLTQSTNGVSSSQQATPTVYAGQTLPLRSKTPETVSKNAAAAACSASDGALKIGPHVSVVGEGATGLAEGVELGSAARKAKKREEKGQGECAYFIKLI